MDLKYDHVYGFCVQLRINREIKDFKKLFENEKLDKIQEECKNFKFKTLQRYLKLKMNLSFYECKYFVRVDIFVIMHIFACTYFCVRVYFRVCTYFCVRAYFCVCAYFCVRAYTNFCVRAHIYACVHIFPRVQSALERHHW